MPVVPPLNTDSYPQYEELSQYLHNLEEAVPHLVKVYSIGVSPLGRPLLVAEVTNQGTGQAAQKSSVWIDGNSRGRDAASSVACLAILHKLASEHGRDELVTDVLDRFAFYIMPRVCPDEAEEYLLNGGGAWEIRAGVIPSDIDGDGRVLQMRQRHPLGEWKVSSQDERLLVPRLPGDNDGVFYHLYREGVRSDDERLSPAKRRSEWQARDDFLRSVKTVAIALSLGASGESGILLSGLEAKSGDDRDLWKLLGQRLAAAAEVPCLERADCCDEWADTLYREQGVIALSVQLWDFARLLGLNADSVFSAASQLQALKWLDKELKDVGFVPWHSFIHPQFGAVELGGWDLMQTWYNPPAGRLLQAYCGVHVALALDLTCLLPGLAFSAFSDATVGWAENDDPHSEDLSPLRCISLELSNNGYLPSWITCRAKELGGNCGITLTLELPESVQLLSRDNVCHAAPLTGLVSSHLGPEGNSVFCGAPAEKRSLQVSWIVRGEGSVNVRAEQPRAGRAVYASQNSKKAIKTAPAYQAQSESRSLAAEKPGMTFGGRQTKNAAAAAEEEKPESSVLTAPAAKTVNLPKSGPGRSAVHHTVTRGELAANSSAAQARNVSLLKGMTKIGGGRDSREEKGKSGGADSLASETVLGSKSVRPVSLISKSASSDGEDNSPAPEPKIPSAGEQRGAMSGYRPSALPPMRLSHSEKSSSSSASAGDYRSALEREKPASRSLIRSDSPLRKEQSVSSGRVFGQSGTKSGSVESAASASPARATFGRPVGQTDLERRQFERPASEVTTFEGHEVKPHSLLGSKKKPEPEEEKAPETPSAPIPSGPVTAQLLRRPKDTE